MGKKLRFGIVGCGGIAQAKHFPSLSKLDEVELYGFSDHDGERALEAKQQFGSKEAKVFPTFKEMIADSSIDVVHVCTSNDSHADLTVLGLEAGKHVMCEKPMAITSSEARRMNEAAERSNKKLTIGYNNRFRKDSMYLKKLCEQDALGDIYFAKAHALRRLGVPTWGTFLDKDIQGGGPLIDIGTHALDLTLWLMNNYKPKVVLGQTFHKLSKLKGRANPYGEWDPEDFSVEDSAFGMIKMENGATITLESSWALHVRHDGAAKTTLCGTKAGADMWDGLHINGEENGELYTRHIELEKKEVNFFETKPSTPGEVEARMWVEAILEDKEPVVTAHQALVVTEILEALYESSRTGKAIYFNE
ncbi:Gfo/Idh/MocA family protein [Radiobacillus sp. PE A8.2]|uniref:Gfo/Idh/MocA family protein n=1 Tax=Radiobacillus sp. PE A8.2 TaxID=3380349 RepID=UPI00389101F5